MCAWFLFICLFLQCVLVSLISKIELSHESACLNRLIIFYKHENRKGNVSHLSSTLPLPDVVPYSPFSVARQLQTAKLTLSVPRQILGTWDNLAFYAIVDDIWEATCRESITFSHKRANKLHYRVLLEYVLSVWRVVSVIFSPPKQTKLTLEATKQNQLWISLKCILLTGLEFLFPLIF